MKKYSVMLFALAFVGAAYGEEKGDAPLKVKTVLTDGSQLLGTACFTSLTLVTEFGKFQIPVSDGLTLDFANGKAKVKLFNDILFGTLEGSAFKIATSFGEVNVDGAMVKTIQFSKQRQGAAQVLNEAGLLLHVPLDTENTNLGAFNARMEARNINIVDGHDGGKATLIDSPDARVAIDLPFSPYTMREGTIEFWAKLPQPHKRFSDGGQPWFFDIERLDCEEQTHIVFGFNANNGVGQAGLVGIIWHFSNAGTHRFGEVSNATQTGVLRDTPDGWHHYAFIWKWDGLDIADGQEKVLLLTVDGKAVASSRKTSYYKNHLDLYTTETKCRLILDNRNAYDIYPKAMSGLKIWNRAKLPGNQ